MWFSNLLVFAQYKNCTFLTILRLLALGQSALHQEVLLSYLKTSKPLEPEGLQLGFWGHIASLQGNLRNEEPSVKNFKFCPKPICSLHHTTDFVMRNTPTVFEPPLQSLISRFILEELQWGLLGQQMAAKSILLSLHTSMNNSHYATEYFTTVWLAEIYNNADLRFLFAKLSITHNNTHYKHEKVSLGISFFLYADTLRSIVRIIFSLEKRQVKRPDSKRQLKIRDEPDNSIPNNFLWKLSVLICLYWRINHALFMPFLLCAWRLPIQVQTRKWYCSLLNLH